MKEKNLDLERLVFFSDAIVAIAMTLLVFGLQVNVPAGEHLTFKSIAGAWPHFSAFFLSFFIIGLFWKIHHEFFHYIRLVDSNLLWFNIIWLLFIALIPFTSSLISTHFFDRPAIVCYCLNILCITIFQNTIWDYVAARPDYLKDISATDTNFYRIACNVAMVHAVIALILAFFYPLLAFIILLTRLPAILLTRRWFMRKLRKKEGKTVQNL